MALLRALSPEAEISSAAISSLVNAVGPFKNNALKLLAKQGIEDLTPGKWYSQQAFLDAFQNIPVKIGDQTLVKVGANLAKSLNFPSGIDTLEKALAFANAAYQEYYRNGDTGGYVYQKTGERECTMTCSSPYPCAFDQGVLTGICNRFKPADSDQVMIEHSDATGCRKSGGVACTFVVKW